MAVRASKQMTNRLREMLTRDKVGVRDGFLCMLNKDINRLLADYFDLEGEGCTEIVQDDDGYYTVTFSARASRIRSFESTADIKRY